MIHLPARTWDPTVHARLTTLLGELGPADDVVLDWDDTTIEGDSSLAWMDHLDQVRRPGHLAEYRAVLARDGRHAAYPLPAVWMAGWTPRQARGHAERVVADALATGRLRFRPELRDLAFAVAATGARVWVVTASPTVLITAMATRIRLPASRILGMAPQLGADGRYTGQLAGTATVCEGKAVVVAQALEGRAPALVAGDSRSDAWMLAMGRHAMLIDGHDHRLRADAQAAGWWIQSGWRHTPPERGELDGPGVDGSDRHH